MCTIISIDERYLQPINFQKILGGGGKRRKLKVGEERNGVATNTECDKIFHLPFTRK